MTPEQTLDKVTDRLLGRELITIYDVPTRWSEAGRIVVKLEGRGCVDEYSYHYSSKHLRPLMIDRARTAVRFRLSQPGRRGRLVDETL